MQNTTQVDDLIAGTAPPSQPDMKQDKKIRFVDDNSSLHRESGERVVYDLNDNKIYDAGDTSIAGTSQGTTLRHDFTIESAQRWTYGNCGGSTTRCKWVSDAIDNARQSGSTIRWIVAVTHKNFIEMGQNVGNEIGEEFFNFLVQKGVDLILQGNDHNYQRSNQLALSQDCPVVTTTPFDPDCNFKTGGPGTVFWKRLGAGQGSILAIVGAFGREFDSLVTSGTQDVDRGYFQYAFAPDQFNANAATHGYLKVEVGHRFLRANFVNTSGTFTDSFEIRATRVM